MLDGTTKLLEYELWEQDRESISKSHFAELNWLVNQQSCEQDAFSQYEWKYTYNVLNIELITLNIVYVE